MSKKGIFSTDSKAQLRHERSKRFAVSMMIKKDMEEKERERQRFEMQLERDLDELDRKYGTSTDYSYNNTHHRKTASKTVPSEPPESQAMLYWAGTVMIVLSFSSILYMIGNSSEILMLSYNLSSLAAIGTIGTSCIYNIATHKKGARWRCLIVGVISYALTIWAQMIYPDEAKHNHVSSMPTEYPSIMLIFFSGAILGFTLMAVLITNSMFKEKEKNSNTQKYNDTKKDRDIPDLLRTELDNQQHKY